MSPARHLSFLAACGLAIVATPAPAARPTRTVAASPMPAAYVVEGDPEFERTPIGPSDISSAGRCSRGTARTAKPVPTRSSR